MNKLWEPSSPLILSLLQVYKWMMLEDENLVFSGATSLPSLAYAEKRK